MPTQKSPTDERSIIVGQPTKRPYGARICIHVQTAGALGNAEEVEIPLSTGAFVTVAPDRAAPWEGGRKYALTLEGFATAGAAEVGGRRLVQALLWMAISSDTPLRLQYRSYEPAAVFERNRPEGAKCIGYAEVSFSAEIILTEIHDAFALLPEPDPKLLLSMEIFAGAGLEVSDRARFLAIVSALEPLAEGEALGSDVDEFVSECLENLKGNSSIHPEVRQSLEGRLRELREESVRQAILRVVRGTFPERPDVAKIIDNAYGIRSEVIHYGRPDDLDVDLDQQGRKVRAIIRELYASRLGKALLKPAAV